MTTSPANPRNYRLALAGAAVGLVVLCSCAHQFAHLRTAPVYHKSFIELNDIQGLRPPGFDKLKEALGNDGSLYQVSHYVTDADGNGAHGTYLGTARCATFNTRWRITNQGVKEGKTDVAIHIGLDSGTTSCRAEAGSRREQAAIELVAKIRPILEMYSIESSVSEK